jgi:hypothetical protein
MNLQRPSSIRTAFRSMWLWTRRLPPHLLGTASLAAIKGANCLID